MSEVFHFHISKSNMPQIMQLTDVTTRERCEK